MHSPKPFQIDRAASLAFAEAHGFGLVCASIGERPVASPLPFQMDYACDGTPRVAFHVARGNALAALANRQCLIAVTGPHSYVSPHWYASPDQVPTWLYQSVHLTGVAAVMSDTALVEHLDALSASFENRLGPKPPWTTVEIARGRREALMKAIVGFVVSVERIEGSFKLNQHKSDADHVAVATMLSAQTDGGAQATAEQMVALRPQLDYKSPASVCGLAV